VAHKIRSDRKQRAMIPESSGPKLAAPAGTRTTGDCNLQVAAEKIATRPITCAEFNSKPAGVSTETSMVAAGAVEVEHFRPIGSFART
jgi:hypothetical protein